MNFKFTDPRKVGTSLSPQQIEQINRWEKERADGKWFWIFKRASAWLVSVILMFGAANYFAGEMVSFGGGQVVVAAFMFGGFFIGSIMEWAKMEELYETTSLTTD
jgi:hypothetical protein